MDIVPGGAFGHYRFVEKIGEGGMGVVWKAMDTRLDREVAVKVLPETVAHDRERMERFNREAKVLASLNHPAIAGIYGLEERDGRPLLVMELVPGQDLAHRLEAGPVPVEEALEAARQVADGLEAAHESGVIHRDLKPANLMLDENNVVKLTDFGIAKLFGGTQLTADGGV
ncbi:MAG: serine/threonine-protein kinase, partial [Acidobacteriota bacterium]